MLKYALSSIEKLYRQRTIISCILVAVIVLIIDYFTGKFIRFPITYVIPVGLAAWRNKKVTAYTIAVLLPLARLWFQFPWYETQSLYESAINASVRVSALVLYAYLVDRTAWQTRALEKKVGTLEGILPICASCKRIRNEKGEYVQLEKYITEHSEASFSHGLCQECSKKLYPEYFKDDKGKAHPPHKGS
jgi:hypothetical protein